MSGGIPAHSVSEAWRNTSKARPAASRSPGSESSDIPASNIAEKAGEGRALNAGLEQVRGRVVWEILIQNAKVSRQVHIDPITGEIL